DLPRFESSASGGRADLDHDRIAQEVREREIVPLAGERTRVPLAAEAALAGGEAIRADDQRLLPASAVVGIGGKEAILVGERREIARSDPEEREWSDLGPRLAKTVVLPGQERLRRREEEPLDACEGQRRIPAKLPVPVERSHSAPPSRGQTAD